MNFQHTLDLQESKRRKTDGMDAAAVNRRAILSRSRYLLRLRASTYDREVSADDVDAGLWRHLGPAAGSLFRGGDWFAVGWKASSRVGNHGRMIRQWRLKGVRE